MTVRVAVIGVGSMGRNHARVYSEMPGVELVALVDGDLERAAGVRAGLSGEPWITNDLLALQDWEINAVSICVPTKQHKEVTQWCLRSRLAVLVEKPLAATSEEAACLCNCAGTLQQHLQVGHIERFNPAIVELKRYIGHGALGDLHYLQFVREGPFAPRIRDVGVVHDLMVHDLDLARWLTGREPTWITGQALSGIKTPHEDAAGASALFGNTLALFSANWLSTKKQRSITVWSDRGIWEVDLIGQSWTCHDRDGTEHMSRGFVGPEPLRAELDAFIAAVRGEAPVPVTGEDGLRAVELAEAVVRAAEERRVVELA